jgi:hypothetical protein
LSNSLARLFWIPVASLVAVEIYAAQFDGWGVWATAPLFLLPFILSVVIASAGLVKCIVEFRKGSAYVLYMVFYLCRGPSSALAYFPPSHSLNTAFAVEVA